MDISFFEYLHLRTWFLLSLRLYNTVLKFKACNWILLLQVHLIEGIIDQVEGTVHVSWVQPRVLGIQQIKSLRDRLDSWTGKVHTALLSIEAETPDLIGSWFFFNLVSVLCNNFLSWREYILRRQKMKRLPSDMGNECS